MQWGVSIVSSRRVGVCTVVDQQQPRDIPMAFSTCPMQWGPSSVIRCVGVCTIVEQPLRLSCVSSATGLCQFLIAS